MRYPAEYKDQARAKLVEASGRHAKQHGFIDSGLSDLAAAAGVTTGSLYKHFSGKQDLFVSMIAAELKRTSDMYGSVDAEDSVAISRALAAYLSPSHVRHPEAGCPLPSLTPEVGRAGDDVKSAFEQGVRAIHANVKALTGDSNFAWTVMAQTVGAVMIARALKSETLQRELLKAVRQVGEQFIAKDKLGKAGKKRTAPV